MASNWVRVGGSCRQAGCSRQDGGVSDGEFARLVLAAPAGVSLVQALEIEHRADVRWFDSAPDADVAAVRAATDSVGAMSWGDLVRQVVAAAECFAGPWSRDAPTHLARAFRLSQARSPIAGALAERFDAALHASCARDAQQWWESAGDEGGIGPRFGDHRQVYCCGEFSWQGIWTVSDPPSEAHDDLVDVWELFDGPISRWLLPIDRGARVFDVHAPADWAHLVATFPRMTDGTHSGWELPGPNQHLADIHDVEVASAGSAARHDVHVAMPDWPSVAVEWDGVHLSWAGMLTSEGKVTPVPELGSDVVTMLRYWGSERTLWLRDVFSVPQPHLAPALSGRMNNALGVATTDDPTRRARDERVLTVQLGRNPFGTSTPSS
jgi:hypothetical protein